MFNKNKNGFTLVEVLAVISVLSVILLIAVPTVMNIIEMSNIEAFESSVELIKSSAEKKYLENSAFIGNQDITCDDIIKLNEEEYGWCDISINNGKASVTLEGKGKFNGLKSYGTIGGYIENLYKNEEKRISNGLIMDDTIDKNIRYVGSNPNNYVYFNCKDKDTNNVKYGSDNYDYASSCEVWRIIGVFEVDNGEGKLEKRVKIVRDALSVRMSWDSSVGGENIENSVNYGQGINQWGESTYEDGSTYEGADLMRMLNGYYIGKLNTCEYCNGTNQGTCSKDCSSSITPLSNTSLSMLESVVWDTGAVMLIDPMPITTMYNGERETQSGKICEASSTYDGKPICTDTVNRTTEWVGKIGLIYASDYGYASADENCAGDIVNKNSTCKNNNWLYTSNDYYWTLSPFSYRTISACPWVVHPTSSVVNAGAGNAAGVRPSIYLKADINIIGGDGASIPYKLSI